MSHNHQTLAQARSFLEVKSPKGAAWDENGSQELLPHTPLTQPPVSVSPAPCLQSLPRWASGSQQGLSIHPSLQILGELVPWGLTPLWVQETSALSGAHRCCLSQRWAR